MDMMTCATTLMLAPLYWNRSLFFCKAEDKYLTVVVERPLDLMRKLSEALSTEDGAFAAVEFASPYLDSVRTEKLRIAEERKREPQQDKVQRQHFSRAPLAEDALDVNQLENIDLVRCEKGSCWKVCGIMYNDTEHFLCIIRVPIGGKMQLLAYDSAISQPRWRVVAGTTSIWTRHYFGPNYRPVCVFFARTGNCETEGT
eukprot:ANDGO_07303.mRNA.1 hypothetical protein